MMSFYNLKLYFPYTLSRCQILVPELRTSIYHSKYCKQGFYSASSNQLQCRSIKKNNKNEVSVALQGCTTPNLASHQGRQFSINRIPPVLEEDELHTNLTKDISDPVPVSEETRFDLDSTLQMEMEGLSVSQKKAVLEAVLDKKLGVEKNVSINNLIIQYANELDDTNIMDALRILRDTASEGKFSTSSLHKLKEFKVLLNKLKQKYPVMTRDELLLTLHCLDKFEVDPMSKYFDSLLQILKFHAGELTSKNIVFVDGKLKNLENPRAKEFCFALTFLMENHLAPEELSKKHLLDLLVLLGYCIQNHVNGTDRVIAEIRGHNIYSTSYAVSLLWNIFDIPKYPIRSFLISPQNEINIEVLTKECLTVIARNIDVYNTSNLMTTLSKAERAFSNGNKYVYHEYFLQELADKAVKENWNVHFMSIVIIHQFQMGFVHDDLVLALMQRVCTNTSSLKSSKFLHTFSALSCLEQLPKEALTFIDRVLQENLALIFKQEVNNPWILKATELMSMDYFSKELLENIYLNKNLKSLTKSKPPHVQFMDSLNLLEMNYFLKNNSLFNYLYLSDDMEEYAVGVIKEKFRNVSKSNRSSFGIVVENVVKNPLHYASYIQYKRDLFIDQLMVIDENGFPVLLSDTPMSNVTYEELQNIEEHHKKIAIMNINTRWIFNSDKKLYGVARLRMKALLAEGFHVIQSLESEGQREREQHLELQLLHLGVKLI